jgi:predicted phosphodiesterase
MRVAVFSDVHGNLTSLEAVLDDIARQAPDVVVFAGDLCVFGARPAECLARVKSENIPAVYGNTDEWIGDERRGESDPSGWARAQLAEADRVWLGSLAFEHRVSPTSRPEDDLLVVHANPVDVNQPIWPPAPMQRKLYGEIRQNDRELETILAGIEASVIAFGHVHIPNLRPWNHLLLANISSVSLGQDSDTRAKYGLLTWDKAAGWSVEHRFVEYDIEAEFAHLSRWRPPNWQGLGQRIRTAPL